MSKHVFKHNSKQKAKDLALWLNFEHRASSTQYGAIPSLSGGYLVAPTDHPSFKGEKFLSLPDSYKKMSYAHIQGIATDEQPLVFWEAILGTVSSLDVPELIFLLDYRVPLHRFARFELACRGYNSLGHFCGYEKAMKIWLK